jgi:alpha-1,3-mannosyl-glycoprotein beta-1,2-N-acetylglucosaminyltransferase
MENVVQVHQNKHPGRKPMEVWKKPTAFLKTPVQKIAAHFKFALSEAFDHYHYEFGVFIENDLELAPDALWYFRAAAWLLEEDPSLFCISAWNDNGFKGLVSNEKRLFRTDYFPGLGWMIRNDTWTQLRGIWPVNPTTGWDHWVRHGSGLRPRECIVPEVSRSHHFDERGTNVKKGNGMARLLAKMAFSTLQPAELNDFSYLLKDKYEQQLTELLKNSQVTTIGAGGFDLDPTRTYLLPYIREEYKNIAKRLEIYGAQPRTAHRGMVMTRHPSTKALLILVDRRQAVGILPEIEQLRPNPQLRIGAAPKGRSCDWFCHLHQMRCDPAQLEFINHCSVLKEYFPCERGCGHQVGLEIPCYAHDSKMDTAFQCLVTDEVVPACKAGHKSTTRLCACVPV